MTRRDDRAYREYVREEQRSQRGCIAGRMQLDVHRGLLGHGPGRRCAHFPEMRFPSAVERFAEQHVSGQFSSI
jgi:hypothetical protein